MSQENVQNAHMPLVRTSVESYLRGKVCVVRVVKDVPPAWAEVRACRHRDGPAGGDRKIVGGEGEDHVAILRLGIGIQRRRHDPGDGLRGDAVGFRAARSAKSRRSRHSTFRPRAGGRCRGLGHVALGHLGREFLDHAMIDGDFFVTCIVAAEDLQIGPPSLARGGIVGPVNAIDTFSGCDVLFSTSCRT